MSREELSGITTVSAWKVRGEEIKEQAERLAVEAVLALHINGLKAFQLLYLPGLETELIAGFLLTGGIIESTSDIAELRLTSADPAAGRPYAQAQVRLSKTFENKRDLSALVAEGVLTGAAVARQPLRAAQFATHAALRVQVSLAEIKTLLASLPERQAVFRQTGATHAIFLAQAGTGQVILGAEDVGRHNAFDKVVGQALIKNLSTGDKIALLSGRASFEMVYKAARAGIPLMASVSAPTSLAVRLAELQGITLMGFVRGERLNVYTHLGRIAGLGVQSA